MISMINVPRCEWDYWTGLPADNCARIEAGRSESREGDRAGRCTTLRLVIRIAYGNTPKRCYCSGVGSDSGSLLVQDTLASDVELMSSAPERL